MRNHFTQGSSHIRKLCIVFGVLLMAGLHAASQTTLAQWNFNSTFTIAANGTAPGPSSNIAPASIVLIGGVTASDAMGVNADSGSPNNGLNTASYPAQNNFPKTAGIKININTAGYNSIHLKFYVRHSGSAAKKVIVQYFDGTTWQDVFTYLATNTNFSTLQQDVDLSAYIALDNNSAAQIRLVTDYSITNMYEGATGAYAPGINGGTIRYDLVTITGNPNSCIGPATIQATGFRLLKTDASSAQLTLNRGNGMGCLVVCSQSGIPSAPANGNNYVANSFLGAGNAIGNGFAVLNTWATSLSIQYFNITNLVAGTKYYVAAYEYSSGSYCYLGPGYVDSFICNSTVLYPGDVQFVGYDNNIASGGDDAFAITNLVSLNPFTSFQVVNSRFEAGASANTRTNQWYAGGTAIYSDLQTIDLLYTGAVPLPPGKIISFDFKAPNGLNIKVNGVASANFIISSKNVLTGVSILSTTGAEQFFLTQGKFTSYGTSGVNQYSLLNGHVLHGISYTNNWVGFGQGCSAGTNPTDRQSRVPPDIKCMNLFFNTSGNSHAYYLGPLHTGSQGLLLSEISNSSRWSNVLSTAGNDITPVNSLPFNITGNTPSGTWTGAADFNWFNCENWEGRFVPDSTTDAIIPTVSRRAEIDINVPNAGEYNKQAITRALTINTGIIAITGNAPDKIVIYDSLLLGNTGVFTAASGIDTVVVRGNIQIDNPSFQLATNGWLSLEGNRLLQPISISLASVTPVDIYILTLNNGPGVRILNGGFESIKDLQLNNGILSFVNNNAFHYIGSGCTVSSPLSKFAETRGYEKSYIDGKVYVRTNGPNPYIAPIGNAAKDVFAPMGFTPNNDAVARTYVVSYIASSHPNVMPADVSTPPLDRVSSREYWSITSDAATNPAAKIILYYTPYSRVGGGGNNAQALADLRIAQYWDSSQYSAYKWRLYGSGANSNYNTSGFDTNYGKINCSEYATDLRPVAQNFTIATISAFNILPIDLLSWKAIPQGKRVQLNWKVAEESMVNFYTIEKSVDGVHFTNMQTIYKSGGGGNYTSNDYNPADGWNYYRLKATGTDGKIFYSVIEKVFNTASPQFAVYPNPASDMLWLQLPVAGTVCLYTMDGRIVMQNKLPALLNRLNIKSLAKGMYIVEYFDGRKKWSEKIRLQ